MQTHKTPRRVWLSMRPYAGWTAIAAAVATLAACSGGNDVPTYAATIRTTSYGVPHVVADNFKGAGYGYGYAFAQENICLYAEELVTLHGERAKYFGATGGYVGQLGTTTGNVDSDFFYKLIFTADQAAKLKAGSSQAAQDLANGFATGYNRYLKDTGVANLPTACKGAAWVQPMTENDAYLRFSQAAMTGSSMAFINAIGQAQPPAKASAGQVQAQAQSASTDYVNSPIIQGLAMLRDRTIGSNGLGLGRETTQSGAGLLMGNPHFPWWGALRLNQLHLTVTGENFDVMGATLLGVPIPLIGFNDKVAWTHTFSTDNRFTLR